MTPLEDVLVRPRMVWRYYEDTLEALRTFRHALVDGSSVVAGSRFFGMPPSQVQDELEFVRAELDNQVTLALVAAFEAILRVDAMQRVLLRLKDPTSQRFKAVAKRCAAKNQPFDRVDLSAVLKIWRDSVHGGERDFELFGKLMSFRHWLAHGRYWTLKIGPPPDPATARNIAEAVFARLPKFTPPSFS